MYKFLKVKDVVRILFRMFMMDLKEVVKIVFREIYEGIYDRDEGVVLVIFDVEEISEGVIVLGDGVIYYEVIFNVFVWELRNQEVVEGEVVEMMFYGVFIRIGLMDGFVYISQFMDDYVVFDEKNRQFIGKEINRVFKFGDYVRVRIIGVSVKSRVIRENKINMMMCQFGFGKFEWIEKEKKKVKEEFKGE